MLAIIQRCNISACMASDCLKEDKQNIMVLREKSEHENEDNAITRYIEGDLQQRKEPFIARLYNRKWKQSSEAHRLSWTPPKTKIITGRCFNKSQWFLRVTLPSLITLVGFMCGALVCGIWFAKPTEYVYLTYFHGPHNEMTTTIQVNSYNQPLSKIEAK